MKIMFFFYFINGIASESELIHILNKAKNYLVNIDRKSRTIQNNESLQSLNMPSNKTNHKGETTTLSVPTDTIFCFSCTSLFSNLITKKMYKSFIVYLA